MKKWLAAIACIALTASLASGVVVRRGGVKITAASRIITFESGAKKDLSAIALNGNEFGIIFETGVNDTLWVAPDVPFGTQHCQDNAIEIVNPNGDTIYVSWVQHDN